MEIERRCPTIAEEIYGSSVEIGISLGEGSLRVWVVITECIWTASDPAYNTIANYIQFKLRLNELYEDAKQFGESVFRIVRENSAISASQVYRVERRTKTVGRIIRAIKMIDELNRDAWRIDKVHYEERVLEIRYRIHPLLKKWNIRAMKISWRQPCSRLASVPCRSPAMSGNREWR